MELIFSIAQTGLQPDILVRFIINTSGLETRNIRCELKLLKSAKYLI